MTTTQLSGKTALVTGGSRGLGLHIVRALAKQGLQLAIVARDQDTISRLASELSAQGARATAIAADLSDVEGLNSVVTRAERALGHVDVLINNAGIDGIRMFSSESEEDTEHMLNLNLLAPMLLTRKLLPKMLERKTGHIVNIASIAGKSGMPFGASYAATKAGMIGFTHSLRAELRGSGVSASLVTPGFISGEGMWAKQEKAHGAQVSPLIGTSKPEQVTQAVIAALQHDRAEIMVNPGPMRLFQAMNQLVPDTMSWMQNHWFGLDGLMKRLALADQAKGP
jgi:short-subunit dehydrogenase